MRGCRGHGGGATGRVRRASAHRHRDEASVGIVVGVVLRVVVGGLVVGIRFAGLIRLGVGLGVVGLVGWPGGRGRPSWRRLGGRLVFGVVLRFVLRVVLCVRIRLGIRGVGRLRGCLVGVRGMAAGIGGLVARTGGRVPAVGTAAGAPGVLPLAPPRNRAGRSSPCRRRSARVVAASRPPPVTSTSATCRTALRYDSRACRESASTGCSSRGSTSEVAVLQACPALSLTSSGTASTKSA